MGTDKRLLDALLKTIEAHNASLLDARYALIFILADVVRQMSTMNGDEDEEATLEATFEFLQVAVEYQNNTPIESAVAH